MKMPANDSPLWGLARMALRAAVIAGCLAFVYKQVDVRDVITLAIFVLSDGAISSLTQGSKPRE
jgi:hypothetical protein